MPTAPSLLGSFALGLALAASPAAGWEPPEDEALLPDPAEDGAGIARDWSRSGPWYCAPARVRRGGGTRVGALVRVSGAGPLEVQARGRGADGAAGPWVALAEVWADGEGQRVLVADLGRRWPRAEVRLRAPERVASFAWELRVPVGEPRGAPSPEPPAVSAALQAIGVVSREEWGASATTCTSTEDDWYRMAIHHTAGSQTSGGTVQGAVRALQAYAMGSGEYCDIPYQFLVGYDGSLWEGRPLAYYSGATGGGNNDGNIALSFLGCYDPSCSAVGPHDATDAMMAWARLLIWTLAGEHAFAVDSDTVRGHRDWPGNATACPGEYVVDRFGELLSPTSYYQASFVDQSFPALHEGDLEVPLGGEVAGWFDLRNDGMETWQPGATFLATIPRDVASSLAGSDWVSPTRAATVQAATAPGQVGRFSLSIAGPVEGTTLQRFALVQEWVTWFADAPWGGGPPDDLLAVSVEVVPPGTDDSGTGPDSQAPDTSAPDPDSGADPWRPPGARQRSGVEQGCGCGPLAPAVGLLPALLGMAWAGTQRRRVGTGGGYSRKIGTGGAWCVTPPPTPPPAAAPSARRAAARRTLPGPARLGAQGSR